MSDTDRPNTLKEQIVRWVKTVVASLLDDWFVPVEDYRYVQDIRWGAEHEVRRLIDRQQEILGDLYGRYKGFEHYAETAEVEYVEFPTVDLEHVRFGYQVSIPRNRFYTMTDIRELQYESKSYIVHKLTEAFKSHISKKLFPFPNGDLSPKD